MLHVHPDVLLFEYLILDLLVVDLLEHLLNVVLRLLEDTLLLRELHLQRFHLHRDLTQL